jgi:predicted nucleic acid-binding protein
MILLDANYLIGAPKPGSPELAEIQRWRQAGESIATSAIAWTEFLSGPVTEENVADLRVLLDGGVLEFDEACAITAARLFNATGRKRHLRVDGMIAATTLENHARLATHNLDHFQPFLSHGLKLAPRPA